ncbi:hypothetical protein, partial [Mesorhizobium sp. M2D.F.Ca.ET.223.01.1.1]|uniref:hypothetical protein n=1 Tax=Mesorhizobium sp. M2D.F.Ca.ET.223.01.1.1 TaxID=2563940 RepID=UPI001AED8FF8
MGLVRKRRSHILFAKAGGFGKLDRRSAAVGVPPLKSMAQTSQADFAAMQKSIAAISFTFPPQANRGPRPRCRHNRGGCGSWVKLRAYAPRS